MSADRKTHTAEELLDGIVAALQARDLPAVAALLRLLAVVDPHEAQVVRDMVNLAAREVTR